MQAVRHFSSRAAVLARAKQVRVPSDIKLKKPILPTVNNLHVNEDHPLWEFFHEKSFVRGPKELANTGRHWSVQELRRKSYEDLHALWYVCLKELNKLGRESVIYTEMDSPRVSQVQGLQDEIHNTCLAIRQVLTEREAASANAQKVFEQEGLAYLESFKQSFIEAEDVTTKEWKEKIDRFAYGIWGVNFETTDPSFVDAKYVEALQFVSQMFFDKHYAQSGSQIEELKDITEYLTVFQTGRTPEGFKTACEEIEKNRDSTFFPPSKSIEVLKRLFQASE